MECIVRSVQKLLTTSSLKSHAFLLDHRHTVYTGAFCQYSSVNSSVCTKSILYVNSSKLQSFLYSKIILFHLVDEFLLSISLSFVKMAS